MSPFQIEAGAKRHKQRLVNWRFSRKWLWVSLALVGSHFLGNSWVKSGWRLPHRGWSFSSPATTVRDNIAWIIGIEKIHTVLTNGNAVERSVLATSAFEKRNGQWLMVHHHGSRTPQ